MVYPNLNTYIELIKSFLNGEATVFDFEKKYLVQFKEDETIWVGEAFDTLNELFSDLDSYCENPELRDSRDLDENQLRQKAEMALRQLIKLNKLYNQ